MHRSEIFSGREKFCNAAAKHAACPAAVESCILRKNKLCVRKRGPLASSAGRRESLRRKRESGPRRPRKRASVVLSAVEAAAAAGVAADAAAAAGAAARLAGRPSSIFERQCLAVFRFARVNLRSALSRPRN